MPQEKLRGESKCLTVNKPDAEVMIRDLIRDQAAAVRNKDIIGASRNYAPQVVIYDVVGPLQRIGQVAVKDRLTQWFATFQDNVPVGFESVGLEITASGPLAYCFGTNYVSAHLKTGASLDMYWRETQVWSKINGEWKIIHAHSSVPFDPQTGMGSTGLKPE